MEDKKTEVMELQNRLEGSMGLIKESKEELKISEKKFSVVNRQLMSYKLKNVSLKGEKLELKKEIDDLIQSYEQTIEDLEVKIASKGGAQNFMVVPEPPNKDSVHFCFFIKDRRSSETQ